MCVCGDIFSADHAMICRRGGFIIQRHNELRDLEAEMHNVVCTMLKWNQSYKRLLAKFYQEALIKPLTLDLTSTRVVSGRDKALRSSMSGYATQTQNLIKISRHSKYTDNTKMKRSGSTAPEYWK